MGSIEYLGKKYWEYNVHLGENAENDMAKEIDDILNFELDGTLGFDSLFDEIE